MTQERHRLVQQYVERQKAYVPTYKNHDLANECHPTPPTDVGFGFDTPVLRPRRPRTYDANKSPREAPSPPRKKDKSRNKRKKASTSIDTDSERAARLADRRERKRKKRAIVDPSQKGDEEIAPTTAPKKGRAKKPGALALLYGFSATNVTKDRLTLKPAPSLGVFSKGRASAKKKVAATRKSSSRHDLFSESTFLNKPSEQAADPSKLDDDSDDNSTSSHPVDKEIQITNRTRKHRGKCIGTPALKTLQASTCNATESEIWDIGMQSKLPSSVHDVSSEPEAEGSAPVVLDLHKAEWSASIEVAEEGEERRNKDRTPRLSVTRSRSRGRSIDRGSQLAGLDLRDEIRPHHADAADVSSLHPSHSASQVGRRSVDTKTSASRQVTCEYFIQPKAISVQEFGANLPQTSRSNDGVDVLDTQASDLRVVVSKRFTEPKRVSFQEFGANSPQTSRSSDSVDVFDSQDQDMKAAAALDVQTNRRVASPINSLISAPLPMAEFQTGCEMVPLEFSSDSFPYDESWGRVDVRYEPLGGLERGYVESSVVETRDDRFIGAPEYDCADQGETWDWYPSAGLAIEEAEEGCYDPLEQEYEDEYEEAVSAVEPCFFEAEDEGGAHSERWLYDEGSICPSEEPLDDVVGFLEGRALLLGVPGSRPERAWHEGLSGLVQAEMDVASRLRDHWRRVRL